MPDRKVPSSLKSLGGRPPPPEIDVGGHTYRHVRTFKDDFFAVTSLYEGQAGKVILKLGRQATFLLVPLAWVGRYLARRERAALERLADVVGVPRYVGCIERTGLVRTYIEGHALQKGEQVADEFFAQLRALIDTVHERGMAYVDLEKCENVLVGDDGRPYLIDFQIAWLPGAGLWWRTWPARWLGARLQRGDRYHLTKLQRRTRRDQLSAAELAASYRRPGYVRLHYALTWPLRWLRRYILDRLDPRRRGGERGRIDGDNGPTGETKDVSV